MKLIKGIKGVFKKFILNYYKIKKYSNNKYSTVLDNVCLKSYCLEKKSNIEVKVVV